MNERLATAESTRLECQECFLDCRARVEDSFVKLCFSCMDRLPNSPPFQSSQNGSRRSSREFERSGDILVESLDASKEGGVLDGSRRTCAPQF